MSQDTPEPQFVTVELNRLRRVNADLLAALEAILAEPNDRAWDAARAAVLKARG